MRLVAIASLVVLVLPTIPFTAGGDPGKGKGPPGRYGVPGSRDAAGGARDDDRHDRWHRFDDDDRSEWYGYWRDEYERGHCPPGLAKKHDGCLPPGQAKKRYAIGRPLPVGVALLAVPAPLLRLLPPVEPGYRYGVVDGDLVKLAIGTSLVVDAIDGLSR